MIISQSFKHEEVLGLKFGYKLIGQPKLFSHIYFVDGLLIDTGQSKMRDSIIAATKDLNVEQIFITQTIMKTIPGISLNSKHCTIVMFLLRNVVVK